MQCRNPSLCTVCGTFWNIPGEVEEVFYESGIDVEQAVTEPLETALFSRWRDNVEQGLRQAG